MAALRDDERDFLQRLSDLTHCNPFEPTRIELERALLGSAHRRDALDSWSRTEATERHERPNVIAINARANELAERLADRLAAGGALEGREVSLYDDLLIYTLYYRHVGPLPGANPSPSAQTELGAVYRAFREERSRLLAPLSAAQRKGLPSTPHVFASLHQVRRAFTGIFNYLIGESAPATRLRSAVWESIFTHDLRRYRRVLYERMGDLSTLITGPSGAGKELVALAIGAGQYRSFDERSGGFAGSGPPITALNLSALSPTLIESELFGHRKGSFTGATEDRVGWLEQCPSHGAVFLDEIGELDAAIQVKLLRVAQSRDFSRLGENKPRRFVGKLIAATNRDLAEEMRAGRFRHDLYYRLCSDRIDVPSLSEQLADRPEALGGLVRFLAVRLLGGDGCDEAEAESLAGEVERWIEGNLPADYPWPGNIRELEQCVRSVVVRGAYRPTEQQPAAERATWLGAAERGELTADELVAAYCRHIYAKRGGYEPAAKVLGLDRRTVKARVTDRQPGK